MTCHCEHCRRKRTHLFLWLILILAIPTAALGRSIASLGKAGGYVNDYSSVLTGSEKSQLESICENLHASNMSEMVFVIIDTTDGVPIEKYAHDLFENWGIGASTANNGLLVLVTTKPDPATGLRDFFVMTGYGIEGVIPDTLATRIFLQKAIPLFKKDESGGIVNVGQGLIAAANTYKSILEGEKYDTGSNPVGFLVFLIPVGILALAGVLIGLAVRVKCSRCGGRVKLISDKVVLEPTYEHSGVRKIEYECTICHYQFSRMSIVPMLVTATSSSSSRGIGYWGGSGGFSGGSGFGSRSGGFSSGGGFGGFGGGHSGGGGGGGHW